MRREGREKAAARLQFADQRAAAAGDQRDGAGAAQGGGCADRGERDAARLKVGNDLQHGHAGEGMRGPVAEG